MREYFRDPENTRRAMHGDWLRTGDVARIDADGFVFIVGRSKEMILRGGENISPLEIEEVAVRHPAVREAAAVGVPDRIWGESVGPVRRDAPPGDRADVVEFCRAHLSAFKVPQRVVFVEELPRNAVGKVTRNALRSAFQEAIERSQSITASARSRSRCRTRRPWSSTAIPELLADPERR
jgi:long-chain acyl-CoA synthetase